ncbi:hypothetical protein MTO96_007065 [Rhipicephalus appendiculatus]
MKDNAAEMAANDATATRQGIAPYKSILSMINDIEEQLKEGKSLGFPYVIRGETTDVHQMGFPPITFLRQVVSLCSFPELASHMPSDVVQRAKDILKHCPGGSLGSIRIQDHPLILQHIAEYISQRDCVEAKLENVWFTGGIFHGVSVCYYLDEDHGWVHNIDDMQKALDESKSAYVTRCMLLVNPANPTGTVLSRQQLQDIIVFAQKNCLIILTDEAVSVSSQHQCIRINIAAGQIDLRVQYLRHQASFLSVRKVMNEMGAPYSRTQLISLNSISKGFAGEAGLLSGYIEAINLDPVDQKHLEETMVGVRPSMIAQVALDCIVKPPGICDPSHALYTKEKTALQDALFQTSQVGGKEAEFHPGISLWSRTGLNGCLRSRHHSCQSYRRSTASK